MRLLFVIVVILGALALNGLAAESEPTNLDKVRAVFNFLIEDSFEKYDKEAFKNGLIHFAKAYGDKEQMEEWYKLPEQERDCVKKSKLAWNYKTLNGSFCSTDAELFKMMEKDCPETKEKLNAMFEKQKQMKKFPEEFKSYIEKMPLSFKLLFAKMYVAFETLRKDCNFLSMDKIRAEFLPIIEDRRKIPDEDLQKMAEVFPDMAPAWTGELKKYGDMSLCSLNQWMKTGKLDFMGHVKALRAFVKLSPFKRGIIKKGLDKLMEKKEQDLPDFIVKGIEKDINEGVDWIDNFLQGKSNN